MDELNKENNHHSVIDILRWNPVAAKAVMRILTKKDQTYKDSRHNAHEMTYVISGELKYIIEGEAYPLKEGDIFVIKPGVSHSTEMVSEQCDLLVVYFALSRAFAINEPDFRHNPKIAEGGEVSTASIDQFMEFAGAGGDEFKKEPVFILCGRGKEKVAENAKRILEEGSSEDFASKLMMHALSLSLVIEVARTIKAEWEQALRVKEGKAGELVRIAIEFMDENYAENISVADVASFVFLSQGYFARAFREQLGMTPMAYLIKLRLEKACDLLKGQELKVSAIATKVGFSSPQRFNAAFRKEYNMTPMEYRKKHMHYI